jgi:RelA/SpoT family (p)ppGpp synthetase
MAVVSSERMSVEQTLAALLAAVEKHHPDGDQALVRKGYELLKARVEEQDLPVDLWHALEIARVLADMRIDPAAVTAALVATLVVRFEQPVESLSETLGPEVIALLGGVEKLARIRWDRIEQEAAETLRKMFLAMAQDVRVVLIVLAIRVQLMRSLREGNHSDEEAERIARETLDVFAPLANRLGIWQLKWELEDWSLRVLKPDSFAELTRLLAENREKRNAFIEDVLAILRAKLDEEGIEASVKGRSKHIFSIYKKMQRKQVSFDQIYDVSAVRVVTGRVQDCYAVLGLVHATWVPIPSEFDDYIAKPKDNGYQSLHTAVIGPKGRPVEVQIRTHEMHELSEFGVAAHWAYKESRKSSDIAKDKFMLLRQLMDWESEEASPHQFVESLKTDVFEDQVYVFTPNGDIIDLPLGATPLDFAYRVHTMVGHRCRGARANDQIVPLDYKLKTGDRLEILTHKHPRPSRDWMNVDFGYLRTASARHKVRHWFRKQGRDTAVAEGRELMDKELSRLDLQHATPDEIAVHLKYANVEDMHAALGYGDRSSQSIASAALHVEREQLPPEEPEIPPSLPPSRKKKTASGLRLDGVDNILGKRARCCNPVPGDRVVGFVTRGRGIMIHRRDCGNIVGSSEPERLVDIDWGPEEGERHTVEVEIRANDRPGLMGDISKLVASIGVNITAARAEGNRNGSAWLRLSLECASAEQVANVLQRIDRHRDVLGVRRMAR